jgi:hypothetical protein
LSLLRLCFNARGQGYSLRTFVLDKHNGPNSHDGELIATANQ